MDYILYTTTTTMETKMEIIFDMPKGITITPPKDITEERTTENFTKMVVDATKKMINDDRKADGKWSMKEIVDCIQMELGNNSGKIARAYILKTRLSIEDITQEVGYIERNVLEARQQGKLDKFFKGKRAIKAISTS
jgi:hypothetical protein